MNEDDERYRRRVDFVLARMKELGIDGQAGLIARSGISQPVAAAWLGKKPNRMPNSPREDTTGPLGRALRVVPGWVGVVDAGGTPKILAATTLDPDLTERIETKLDRIIILLGDDPYSPVDEAKVIAQRERTQELEAVLAQWRAGALSRSPAAATPPARRETGARPATPRKRHRA